MIRKLIVLPLLAAALFACATTDGGGNGLPPDGAIARSAGDREDLSLDGAIARSAGDIAAKLPQGTRVVIAAFESPHGNLSQYIMDEITGFLVDGSLEVADRNNLEYVYKELNFQMSGVVSDESARAIGKFLGAGYVLTGQLVNLGGRYRYRLNGINVETAIHESSTRLDVRNDRDFERMLAALRDAAPVVRTAGYGSGRTPGDGTPPGRIPQTAGTFLDRGIMFASRGEYDMAIEDFTQALTLAPDLRAAWMLRGRALYASVSRIIGVSENFGAVQTQMLSPEMMVSADRKAVYDRAIADYTQAIRLDPNFAEAYNARGNAYHHKKDYDRAIADYSQAMRLDPNFAEAYNARGLAYSDKGDYDRAIADLDQAIRLDPDLAMAYFNRGGVYYEKGDYDRAIADYSQAIRLDPNSATSYNNRSFVYNVKKDYDRAIADCSQVIRLNPDYAEPYFSRGFAYYYKGDYDRSITDFNQAIRLNPDYAAAYNIRGVAYNSKGDYQRARADWEQALRINPGDTNARNNLERLRQMGH
jgi:tetratricopeptide (TPR) repeat protein